MDWQNKHPPANRTDIPAAVVAGDVAADELPMRPRALVITHWLTALLLALAVALILVRDQVDGRALRQWLLEGHRHLGLLILLLFFVRAVLRYRLGKWPSASDSSVLVRLAASCTHFGLYALLLVQPLLGWALSSAEGRPVHFLGLTLPPLVGSDEDLADRLTEWHENVAWLLLALITLHVGAALWHHFILRDRTLRMMLTRRRH